MRDRDLTAILARWEDRFGKKRRWQTSRQALRLIIAQPALTTELLARHRGISRRAAQMMAKELEQFGIPGSRKTAPACSSG